jgi:hypothetical protein
VPGQSHAREHPQAPADRGGIDGRLVAADDADLGAAEHGAVPGRKFPVVAEIGSRTGAAGHAGDTELAAVTSLASARECPADRARQGRDDNPVGTIVVTA